MELWGPSRAWVPRSAALMASALWPEVWSEREAGSLDLSEDSEAKEGDWVCRSVALATWLETLAPWQEVRDDLAHHWVDSQVRQDDSLAARDSVLAAGTASAWEQAVPQPPSAAWEQDSAADWAAHLEEQAVSAADWAVDSVAQVLVTWRELLVASSRTPLESHSRLSDSDWESHA